MKKFPWYLLVFTFLGFGLSILAAYAKSYVFGGVEEATVALFVLIGLMIFVPIGFITGKLVEKKWQRS